MQHLGVGDSLVEAVSPRLRHMPTGLKVSPGERYAFAASGRWRDGFVTTGPEGWGTSWLARFNRLPGRPFFLLCGSVGRDDRHAFAIGAGCEWTVPFTVGPLVDRQLHLFANDWRWLYWNNFALDERHGGPLRVRITRVQ
jgi:hypothetical protein